MTKEATSRGGGLPFGNGHLPPPRALPENVVWSRDALVPVRSVRRLRGFPQIDSFRRLTPAATSEDATYLLTLLLPVAAFELKAKAWPEENHAVAPLRRGYRSIETALIRSRRLRLRAA
jgi:hypothetical protein